MVRTDPLPVTLARVRRLAAEGCSRAEVARILGVRPEQLVCWLRHRRQRGWPPQDSGTPIVRTPPDVAKVRAAELHRKLERGPYAMERLIALIQGDVPSYPLERLKGARA